MLANAVRGQKAQNEQQQQKPRGLVQQSFPSSSPPQAVEKEAVNRAPLYPTAASLVNGGGKSTVKPYKLPLKRSSSDMSEMGSLSKSRKISNQSNSQQAALATLSRQSSARLGKLHDATAFDENDLIDEDDLLMAESMFGSPGEVKYPKLPEIGPSYPKLPEVPKEPVSTPSRSVLQSSSAVPWSSSPDSHRLPRQAAKYILPPSVPQQNASSKKQLLGRQLLSTTQKAGISTLSQTDEGNSSNPLPPSRFLPNKDKSSIASDDREPKDKFPQTPAKGRALTGNGAENNPIELSDSPEVLAKKKRSLPWLQDQNQPAELQEDTGSRRMRRPKREEAPLVVSTPAPKSETTSGQLWDQTASAVKAEQKKLRQQLANVTEANAKKALGDEESAAASAKAKSTTKALSEVFLSEEQKSVLSLVVDKKKSVFFTGSAGTGKSVLMRKIIESLKKKHQRSSEAVAVTASTGLAACNIGGNTLHSFAGIGLGKESPEHLVKKIKRNQKAVQRWQRTKVLIIDEISMIDGALFDKLEQIARMIRKKPQAFGGIQIVITGDFFQLPPVPERGGESVFAFDATCWKTTIDHTIGLTHVFRQRDPVFAGMLNEMRVGKLTPASVKAFLKLQRPLKEDTDTAFEATELFPTRTEVEKANNLRMQKLGGTSMEFSALDTGSLQDNQQRDRLLSNCMAPMTITLKKGAQVMLIKNIDDTLVNGSVGKVVGFMTEAEFDAYDSNEAEFLSSGGDFEKMEAAGVDMKKFVAKNEGGDSLPRYPVVRFAMTDGPSRDLLCQRETWKIEQPNGEVLAARSQVPLILAWALSIHKAQGQTLEKVKVDLGRIFEKGQAYVALSRATTQEGLQISRFDANKVMAHPKVRRFYDTLYGVDTIGGMPKIEVPAVAVGGAGRGKVSGGNAAYDMTFEDEESMLAAEMNF